MNIAFDSYALLGPMSRNRGIGNYTFSQFTGMINQDKNNHYFFLNMIDRNYSLKKYIESDSFTEVFIDTGKKNVLLHSENYSDVIGAVIKNFLREYSIDIFYITSPFDTGFTLYKKEWFEGVRTVVTVYDIIPYIMKEKYLSDKNNYDTYMKCVDVLRWADELFVISESVKTDLINCLGFSPDNIRIIWGAVDERFRKISISESEKERILSKFGISKPFVMCTGGEDGRKNLDGLIRSFGLMSPSVRNKYQLAVVCKLSENALSRLKAEASKAGVSESVVFTNFVTDEELLMLYNLSVLMAFPSKYEGFGLPIVEAWACGTPVLTADNSSLCQIAGDSAVLVNADSDKSIAEGLEKMLSDQSTLDEYTKKGAERLKLYRWENVNANTINFFGNIKPCQSKKAVLKKKKTAFFTPLPPLKSGISDYSFDIISELAQYIDIDVYIDNGYTPSVQFPENVKIFNHSLYPQKYSEYSDTVFQMGNSEYHVYMFEYLRKFHGTLVLHDYNMHGIFNYCAMAINNSNFSLYKKFLTADFPESIVDDYIKSLKKGAYPDIYGMEANSYLTSSATRIIVHSKEAKEKLLRKNIARTVKVIPSYAKITPLRDTDTIKNKYGYSPDTLIISAFGGIHRNKRIVPIMKAFSMLRKERSNIRLILCGQLSEDIKPEFAKTVNGENLADSVTVTGYTDIEKFEEYIDMTDICLNLRYPCNGETSGSLMRILARGKCVAVNNIGSFSEIPDGICVKLPSAEEMGEEKEIECIYSTLKKLAESEEERKRYGESARQFAEKNLDIKHVALQYRDFILSERQKPAVTEYIIELLHRDGNMTASDIEGISETLAYAKGIQ